MVTSQGLTPSERALYARMAGKSPEQLEELRRQIMEKHIGANSQLARDIAADIRAKILNDPLLKKDAGIP